MPISDACLNSNTKPPQTRIPLVPFIELEVPRRHLVTFTVKLGLTIPTTASGGPVDTATGSVTEPVKVEGVEPAQFQPA